MMPRGGGAGGEREREMEIQKVEVVCSLEVDQNEQLKGRHSLNAAMGPKIM